MGNSAHDRLAKALGNVAELEAALDKCCAAFDQERKRRKNAEAEIARRDSFDGCDGCSTGDCPHESVPHCVQAQAEIIREREAQVTRQSAELHEARAERDRLRAIVDRLPKTADGVPVVLNSEQTVFAIVRGDVLERASQVLIDTAARGWGYWETGVRPNTRGMMLDDAWVPMERIYSTREAAEAARSPCGS